MSVQRGNANAPAKDIEKFIKFLAIKSTQVVVQSRLGEKIQTECKAKASGSDWFNVVISDHPDIYAEIKLALALEPGQSILSRLPLCVEISLRTVEGDQMVLEVWMLDIHLPGCNKNCKHHLSDGKNADNCKCGFLEQQTLKAAHAIYNRMGTLLKSLISLTRSTPGYKLSRRQCPDSFGIYYRIYVDRPQLHTLGEGSKNVKIGNLSTILGTLCMTVAYRTKMTITPTTADGHNAETNPIMLKSDHFRRGDSSPTQNCSTNGLKKATGEKRQVDIEKPLRPGAFTDTAKLRQWTEKDYVLPETPPFEWLLHRSRHESGGSGGSIESLSRKSDSSATAPNSCKIQEQVTQNNNVGTGSNNININKKVINNNVLAFKSFENEQNCIQAKSPTDSSLLSQSPIKSLLIPAPTLPMTRTNAAKHRPEDEKLLKAIKFPFAFPDSRVNDLAQFYRDCYHAPPLLGLDETQPETAVVQLEEFETSLEDYDELVSQLGLSTSSSTGSRSSGGLQMSN